MNTPKHSGRETYDFHIKTDRFEGPLELLLELVEKRKLLINDISLAEVTDEYMRMVAEMQERSLPHTAQFVALAATLLLIKSRSLLPIIELTAEEEERIDDLEATLKHYQIYRDAGSILQSHFGRAYLLERAYVPTTPVFTPDESCSVTQLYESLRTLVRDLPFPPTKPKAALKPVITLEEMIARVQRRIEQEFRFRFSELQVGEVERKTVAVSFLAILELFKQGHIVVRQERHFADMEIEAQRLSTPRYR